MLVLMFGQLIGCGSLRELTDITIAHGKKSVFLGFGKTPVNRQMLSKANTLRDHRIFEEFAFYMVSIAQSKRITREFELHGRFYAVDSTTIDLCLSVFRWAKFRSTKSGIRIHTQIDIVTEIPVFYRITNAQVHDVNSMDWLTYEPLACYVFDRGYIEHDMQIGRPIVEVMRILGSSLLTKDDARELLAPLKRTEESRMTSNSVLTFNSININ